MSERKVLNKYYPPDFDASKIPKLKLPRDRQYVVRLMAPFNMRCTTCGEYIYKGKKFNARKETVQDETYLGLLIFRFYIRCPKCISEITFKTDPENTDYVCENGATRNFQASRLLEQQVEQEKQEREEEELNNPMKALENRTKESKQEMDILEKLEELKDLNSRHARVDYEALLTRNKELEDQIRAREEAEDEELVRSVFGSNKIQRRLSDGNSDDDLDDDHATVRAARNTAKRATDVLTQGNATTEEPAVKKAKPSWDTGVGKLSSKSALSSLVRVKKPNSDGGLRKNVATGSDKNVQRPLPETSSISINGEKKEAEKHTDNSGKQPGGSSLALLGDYSSSEGDSD